MTSRPIQAFAMVMTPPFESYAAWLKRGPLDKLLSSVPGARP